MKSCFPQQVRKIYDKLQRSERNRVGPGAANAPASAPTPIAAAGSSSAVATAAPSQPLPSLVQAQSQGQSEGQVGRPPPPSFMPAPRIVSSQADAGTASSSMPAQTNAMPAEVLPGGAGDGSGDRREEDRVAGPPEAAAGSGSGGVGNNGRPRTAHGRAESACGAAAAAVDSEEGVSNRAGALKLTVESGGGCRASGDSDNSDGQTVLQVGERLQEAVRLCIAAGDSGGGSRAGEGARPGAPCALTLTEEELSRPRRLLEDLRRLSSRSDGAGAARHEAHGGVGGDEDETEVGSRKGMAAAVAGTEKLGVVLGHALADAGAQRRRGDEVGGGGGGAAMLIGDPLMMETAWLGDRLAKATLGDLLASRLELSLWASFRRRGRTARPSG